MSLHHNGRERTGWTNILAGTTANAGLLVDGGHIWRLVVPLIEGYHFDGSRRTMARAVATLHSIGHRHAILLDEHGMTYLYRRFLVLVNKFDGSRRTHLTTTRTLRTAMAALVRHLRQHQVQQVTTGTQHVVRALRHTQQATRTMLGKMLERQRTRRC